MHLCALYVFGVQVDACASEKTVFNVRMNEQHSTGAKPLRGMLLCMYVFCMNAHLCVCVCVDTYSTYGEVSEFCLGFMYCEKHMHACYLKACV